MIIKTGSDAQKNHRLLSVLIVICFLVSVLIPATVVFAKDITFSEQVSPYHDNYLLEMPGPVKNIKHKDIDQDGLIDILTVYADEDPREPVRNLAIFFQTQNGFNPLPDLSLVVPEDISILDVGEVNADSAGLELLLLGKDNLRWLSLARPNIQGQNRSLESGGEILLPINTAFAHAQRNQVSFRKLTIGLDEEKKATLFLPVTDGYLVYYPDDNYNIGQEFQVEHHHKTSTSYYGVAISKFHLADINGDGRDDLTFTYLDQLRIYPREGERFTAEPLFELELDILSQMDFEIIEGLEALVGFAIRDFDNDGWADLFVWKTVVQDKAIIHEKKQYQLYHNKQGHFELLPDQAFVLKSLDRPDFLDLNGDKKIDMVTGYLDFSIKSLVKALLTKRMKIELSFFRYEDGAFPYQPQEKRDFKIHVSLSDLDENFVPAVEVDGDYDGDDRLDFLLQTENKKIEVFPGVDERDRLFAKKSGFEIETFGSDESFVSDLNGDGKSDIVFTLFPDREPFSTKWINVVLSRRDLP